MYAHGKDNIKYVCGLLIKRGQHKGVINMMKSIDMNFKPSYRHMGDLTCIEQNPHTHTYILHLLNFLCRRKLGKPYT